MSHEGVTMVIEPLKAEELFHTALCNGLGELSGYGFEYRIDRGARSKARSILQEEFGDKTVYFEDVLLQVLRQGDSIFFIDIEGGDEETELTLPMVHERMAMVPESDLHAILNEEDDACTADAIIQTVLFGEIIYG